MEIVNKYFTRLTEDKISKFAMLRSLYTEWNSKINVISRKDIDQLYERHVLHSLGIAQIIRFKAGTQVLDVGTGGGFPGIPLAILFPQTEFYLIDSTGKKITVVKAVAESLNLNNVIGEHIRVQQLNRSFDFIVSRAVTNLPDFLNWTKNKVHNKSVNEKHNGIIYLKGGDFEDELHKIKRKYKIYPLSDFFEEKFFETKKVVHIY